MKPNKTILVSCFYNGKLSQHEQMYISVVRFLFTWLSAMIVPIYYFTFPKVLLVGDLRVAEHYFCL